MCIRDRHSGKGFLADLQAKLDELGLYLQFAASHAQPCQARALLLSLIHI